MKPVLVTIALSTLVRNAAAWGALGHQTVGFIAQQFLAPNAAAFVQTALSPTFAGSLANASTWADTVRSTSAYSWSAPYHFVDAQDNPLGNQCSVSYTRDCAGNSCVLGAISNYTARVVDTTVGATQQAEALRFLDHFLGDVGQPLHCEKLDVGGNTISAICKGSSTNLHAAWDTGIVTQNINLNHGGTWQQYAADLVASIQTGAFQSQAASWITCSSPTQPLARRELIDAGINPEIFKRATITPLACPVVWATDANSFDCTVVFNFSTGQDLCTGTYFANAVPVIDLQLAKQGYRLAAWLNVLFDGSTHLP